MLERLFFAHAAHDQFQLSAIGFTFHMRHADKRQLMQTVTVTAPHWRKHSPRSDEDSMARALTVKYIIAGVYFAIIVASFLLVCYFVVERV